MGIEVIRGLDVPKSSLPFSPAIKAGGFVYVSGQASVDMNGNIVGDTMENEIRRTFENVQRILKAAGLGLKDVVRVCSYVRDPADLAEYNRVYRDIFKDVPNLPARTTLTSCLPQIIKYEADVVAYAGD